MDPSSLILMHREMIPTILASMETTKARLKGFTPGSAAMLKEVERIRNSQRSIPDIVQAQLQENALRMRDMNSFEQRSLIKGVVAGLRSRDSALWREVSHAIQDEVPEFSEEETELLADAGAQATSEIEAFLQASGEEREARFTDLLVRIARALLDLMPSISDRQISIFSLALGTALAVGGTA